MSLVEAASDTPSRRLSAREADPLADLTTQQRRAIELLAEGLLNKQIAHRMGISASTAKAHISAAYRALGVTGRIGAVTLLARAGRMG
ncbi:response regulator transcription factor [Prosthecodimorpha staleyi]|nr:LuxR C-terminal-related transcriptional regulator [Prosthecodimorpha staleyi]